MNSTTRLMTLAIAGVVSASAFAQVQEIPAEAHLVASYPISSAPSYLLPQQTFSFDNTAAASYSGYVLPNTGATSTLTSLIGDDVTMRIYAGGKKVTRVYFSTVNNSAVAFTARPRIRFYSSDRAGGFNNGPGTYLTGFSFGSSTSQFNHPAGTIQLWYFDLLGTSDNRFTVPADGRIWIGMCFDNANGHTATTTDLNNLGMAIYSPPTLGSSQNLAFTTTTPNSGLVNSPPGGTFSFTGSTPPNASFFWRTETTEDPVTATGQILFNSYVAATPSSVNFQWYDTSSNLVAQQVEAVDPSGNFVADTPATAGVYQMSMKTGTWLRRTLTVDTTAGNVSGLVFSLVNGDANNDNTINSDDFDILVANFGGPGPDGDFDGSGSVDSDDFDILVANFGTDGDGP